MKSVIIEGATYRTTALKWAYNEEKERGSIAYIADLAPAHISARIVFMNNADADKVLGTNGPGWNVVNDSILKDGLEGRLIYVHPDTSTGV